MERKVAIGIQKFDKLREDNYFYVDKTNFIKEWWESGDSVTLIMRPYCFGKTLNMSMLETFFSIKYENRGDLFEELSIWKEEKYRKMQGTYPVISLSLASIKSRDYKQARYEMIHLIVELYSKYNFIFENEALKETNKDFVKRVSFEMDDVALTNYEVKCMFYSMVRGWFATVKRNYNGFVKALLRGNLKEMNIYMNDVAIETCSYFDTGKRISKKTELERFYYGFVLGLLTELVEEYVLTSNRESGYGRYDVMLEPKDKTKKAFILEFKIHEPEEENSLKETVEVVLKQIEEMQYEADLMRRGCKREY